MHPSTHQERYHALDATRAFALMLGVVFHAAWSFIPRSSGAPIVDVSSHVGFDWFFFTSHTFRMQTFFLIAGFFARMMVHRRGPGGFLANRLKRIAIPLVVGWLILIPLLILTWIWAANVSGRNLTPIPLGYLAGLLLGKGLILIPRSMGGLFTFAHLWFLYYLLWIYFITLGVRFVLLRLFARSTRIQERTDRGMVWVIKSPWSVLALSVVFGLFLWRMDGWLGVDTPVHTLKPSASVLLLYGTFFGFGWLLHRQVHLLPSFAQYWRFQLLVGLLLSVGLYAVFYGVQKRGISGGLFDAYPMISVTEVTDWPRLLADFRAAAEEGDVAPSIQLVWDKMPETSQARILHMQDEMSLEEKIGVCQQLNKMMVYPELFDPLSFGPNGQPLPLTPRLFTPGESKQAALANRQRLESAFAGVLLGDARLLPWHGWVKLGYAFVYALVMWLLVFGTLGFFQARCATHSPAWRYVADSSYWIYLVHMPLVPWLNVWIAGWPWPGLLKFILLNGVSFLLLFASYHYLVRSTFIGKVLNGRKYPWTPWPWHLVATSPPVGETKSDQLNRNHAVQPRTDAN